MSVNQLPNEDILENLVRRYEKSLPRYTSYPTAPQWHDEGSEFEEGILIDSSKKNMDLSIYVHIPFCESRCLFCGCNTIISRKREKADPYLDNLAKEMSMVSNLWHKKESPDGSKVKQIHFGGGTPTFLSPDQLRKLDTAIKKNFTLADDVEYSIEIDPEVTTLEQLDTLKEMGINRISIGVQDFNEEIISRLNRPQKNGWIEKLVEKARELKFSGINIDLIYGLPGQNIDNLSFSLEKIKELSPERIAFFSYAHVPWVKPHQKSLEKYEILSGFPKFELFLHALDFFLKNGYGYIGLDHFAKKSDPMFAAREEGKLHRNFQGYTTQGSLDMLSFGVSSISSTYVGYWQNPRDLAGYNEKIDQNVLAGVRGHRNSEEDLRRARLILEILCHGKYESREGHTLDEDILGQNRELEQMETDALVEKTEKGFELTFLGQLFSRNIAALFDVYLKRSLDKNEKTIFSKTI